MYEDVIDDEDMPLSRKSILPGTGFFVPDEIDEERKEREVAAALEGQEVAVVADPDADGLACVALVREVFGEGALVPAGPHELEDGLQRVADYASPDVQVFVCDLCPDKFEYVDEELEALMANSASVRWFDHHQWHDDVAAKVRQAGVDLVVGDSEEECTADVALRSLDYDFDEQFAELAKVTRDHDLWLREDPRSDDIADLAYWLEPEEYVDIVAEHGVELPETARELLAERRVEKEALIEKAVERGEIRNIDGWKVAVTYGRCSQNEVAEAFREKGADATVIVKPAGSASIRGTDEFQRCHEVAGQVNGGGHPKAAGCKPRIYDDMLDYAHHWTTRGATTKQVIIDAFRNLPEEDDEGVETER
ncbi:DHH family phosphoesterase [Haloarchaeobius sp. HME9146]|uniref:DHH family phosphoesterase n=1 Tax=Haloarchaeobius sp. HME9146 TaxID=2978732 RepID=UPI0021C21416|nr:recombinase RecJ [Haloarchaeobius sp. HME9146]MCT9095215.1 recombinase RecJ [Haloarchaeobius sp. HME9146]